MSEDEYDQFNLSDFTEDDFIQAETAQSKSPMAVNELAAPAVAIELEAEIAGNEESDPQVSESPLQRFRSGGILSVTDLSAPTWCEVQFEYGLRGRRSMPVVERPKAFKSTSGKVINVETKVAARNEKIITAGRIIHKRLEQEVRPEQVLVPVVSEEERWALRLLNMCACLQSAFEEGFTREIPVFGVVQGQVVVGIIDEIASTLVMPTSNDVGQMQDAKSNRLHPDISSSQMTLEQFLPSTEREGRAQENLIPRQPVYKLTLSDTKTRKSNTLPIHDDTIPARIQLMLYYRLLSDLLSLSPPFDFSAFWTTLDLDEDRVFSPEFLVEAGLVNNENIGTCATLAEAVQLWFSIIRQLGTVELDSTLQIVYRLQPNDDAILRRLLKCPRGSSGLHAKEAEDLAKAIAISLEGVERQSDMPIFADEDEELLWALQESLRPTSSEASVPDEDGHEVAAESFNIIGVKHFRYDDEMLQKYVTEVLLWWCGERRPKGVAIENVNRCRSCEYCNDCEWREQKATEHLQRVKALRGV